MLGLRERMEENGSAPGTGEAKRSAAAPADPEVVDRPLRRRFSPSYKLRIVEEAERCTEPGEVGQLLRREGLAPPWRHLDANPREGPLRERRSGHCRQEIRAPRSMGRSSRTLRQRCAEAQTAPRGRLHQSSHPFPHHTGHCSLINPVECPIVVDRFRAGSPA